MIARFIGCTRGGIAAMTALIAPVLIGVSGLGVELGYWYAVRHSMQGAADASAIEAALSYKNGNTGGYTSAAKAVAAQNGWLDGAGGAGQVISVAVNTPPVNGIYTSSTYLNKAFEVVISRPEKSMFAWAVGYSASPNITVHSVTLITGGGNGCVLALGNGSGAVTVSGNGNLNASGCGVDSDGSVTLNGAPSRLTAGSVTVASNSIPAPGCPSSQCTVSGSVTTNTPTPDPYGARDFTTPPNTRVTSLTSSGTTATAQTAIPHGFTVGKNVTTAGATGAAYNGTYAVTAVPDSTHFKYTMSGTAASPDPGTTITACEAATGATFYPAAIYCGATAPDSVSYASDTVFSGSVSLSHGTTWFGASAAGTCPASASVVYFEGGLSFSGNNVDIHFCPGVYYIEGGSLSVTGSTVNLFGPGVTFILTTLPWGAPSYASASVAGQGTATLTAPTSNLTITLPDGSTATEQVSGLVFFMDRNSSQGITVGGNGSTINLTGAIYNPTGNVTVAGNGLSGALTTCTQVVAQTVTVTGNGTFQSGCTGDGTNPIGGTATVSMVE